MSDFPDSSSHQQPSFCSAFSQSSKDLFIFRDHPDTVMHYRSHCCRWASHYNIYDYD